MDLLRVAVGPLRRHVTRRPLHADQPAFVGVDDAVEVLVVVDDLAVEHARPKGAFGVNIGRVEDDDVTHEVQAGIFPDAGSVVGRNDNARVNERQERGLRVLLALQAVVCTAVGVWGAFLTPILSGVLGLKLPPGGDGIAHLFGATMLAFAVGYALAAAQPHRSRGFLVPLFVLPLIIAVAMIVNIAQHEVEHTVRAGIFAAYNFAYCLLYFRVYPRVPDAPVRSPEAPRT